MESTGDASCKLMPLVGDNCALETANNATEVVFPLPLRGKPFALSTNAVRL